jgi:DNA end-binding protein Ku
MVKSKDSTKRSPDRRGDAAGRSVWSGSISFGLLQIPVTLHPAELRTERLHFHQLDARNHARIQYKRVNTKTGKPVEWKDIVKGFELGDELVVLDADDLAKANVKATKTIDISDFIPAASVAPMFFETPYYVVPRKESSKAYVLLRDALAKKEALAIASFVLRTREHLVALMPVDDAIVLETLRFGHELKTPAALGLPHLPSTRGLSERELTMGEKLVDSMMSEWDPTKYKDTYHNDVMAIVRQKAKHGETRPRHEPDEIGPTTNVVDLFDLLKQSVSSTGKTARGRTTPSPRKAKLRRKAA